VFNHDFGVRLDQAVTLSCSQPPTSAWSILFCVKSNADHVQILVENIGKSLSSTLRLISILAFLIS
jgi:hypothetical protein